ncbi:MAG TPA: hypothetical protein VH914_08030 [Acidimicrobiia bacterium]|nr:hypothetical protein [Acidimicrobiia bacterium]
MEKLMYLLWTPDAELPEETEQLLLADLAPKLLALGPCGLTIDADDTGAQVPPPLPLPDDESPVRAVVSLWLDAYDRRDPFEELLRAHSTRLAGYLVTESMYTDYGGNPWSGARDWADGTRSPGILTVTLLQQKRGTEYEEWMHFWHTRQSPMSEEIQPRARYVRNSVARAITPDAPPYLGIVEEAWPTIDDLTDPMRFYCGAGDEEQMKTNMSTMLTHIATLLDLDVTRVHTMSEWILKS